IFHILVTSFKVAPFEPKRVARSLRNSHQPRRLAYFSSSLTTDRLATYFVSGRHSRTSGTFTLWGHSLSFKRTIFTIQGAHKQFAAMAGKRLRLIVYRCHKYWFSEEPF